MKEQIKLGFSFHSSQVTANARQVHRLTQGVLEQPKYAGYKKPPAVGPCLVRLAGQEGRCSN